MKNWPALEKAKPGFVHYCLLNEGIADRYRGQFWLALAKATRLKEKNEKVFHKLLAVEKVPQEDAIKRDIKRTFSKHQFFVDNCALGQLELFRVLRAYAAYDSEVAYCQGMGFLAAVIVCYIPSEDAFWLLVAVLQHREYDMRQLFRPGMPKFRPVMQRFSKMLEQTVPRVYNHFSRLGVEPGMYASQWFMTLYAYNFPLDFVVRVWDIFFAEGWSIIYRVALTLLSNEQVILETLPFEKVMIHLRDIPKRITVKKVFPKALRLNVPDASEMFMAL